MHRRHRVPGTGQVLGPELGCQLGEPGRHGRGILGRELPGHPHLSQVPVRILHRHAGLPGAPQPPQGYHLRPLITLARQLGVQIGEQPLPAS